LELTRARYHLHGIRSTSDSLDASFWMGPLCEVCEYQDGRDL
jgi:hypothetical protein